MLRTGGGGLLSFLFAKREGITTPYVPPSWTQGHAGAAGQRLPAGRRLALRRGGSVRRHRLRLQPEDAVEGRCAQDLGRPAQSKWKGQIQMPESGGVRHRHAVGARADDADHPRRPHREGRVGVLGESNKNISLYPELGRRPRARSRKATRRSASASRSCPGASPRAASRWTSSCRRRRRSSRIRSRSSGLEASRERQAALRLHPGRERPADPRRLFADRAQQEGQARPRRCRSTTPAATRCRWTSTGPQTNDDRIRNEWRTRFG